MKITFVAAVPLVFLPIGLRYMRKNIGLDTDGVSVNLDDLLLQFLPRRVKCSEWIERVEWCGIEIDVDGSATVVRRDEAVEHGADVFRCASHRLGEVSFIDTLLVVGYNRIKILPDNHSSRFASF